MEYRHGVDDQTQTNSTSNIMPRTHGFTATVGKGGYELVAGQGMTQSRGIDHHTAPVADAQGLVFTTEAGSPVPGGKPRPHDLVEVGGYMVKVSQAVRDGLIADPDKTVFNASTVNLQAPTQAPQQAPTQTQQQAPEQAPYDASEDFRENILPTVSPATTASIEADLMTGEFSQKTLDYLALEANLGANDMTTVRDAYATKIMGATGLGIDDLQAVQQSNPQGFAKAVTEMMRTGSTDGFQSFAQQADDVAFTPLDTDAAMTAWQDPGFPQALIDAGLEPSFDGGVVSINIPGRGLVKWTDAVQQGFVSVDRS